MTRSSAPTRTAAERVRSIASRIATEPVICAVMLTFAVLFNLYHLWPQVALEVPKLNDEVLHLISVRSFAEAIQAGHDPTDRWLPDIVEGYPLFHHYQHLSYLPPALAYVALGEQVGLETVFDWTGYLVLSFFPLSVFWSVRRFGFSPITAALAALAAPLISTDGLYGMDEMSYTWRGFGLYTQLWGMVLLPPALAQTYTTMRTGKGYLWSVLLIATLLLCHLVLGYIGVVSLLVLVFLRPSWREVAMRGRRLLAVLAMVAIVMSYFLVPFWLDRPYMNRGVWELQDKYDSYGHVWVLDHLWRGELFDFDRLPVLTLLVGAGIVVCALRWRDELYRIPVVVGALWLLLYFGRPTWGVLLNLLPLVADMHLHRLIAGVHLGGILLMAVALAVPWRWAFDRHRESDRARYLLAPLLVTVLVLLPAYGERREFLHFNEVFAQNTQDAYEIEQANFEALVITLEAQPPGRVYAGRAANWGKDYKIGGISMSAMLQQEGFDMVGYAWHALSYNADVILIFDDTRFDEYQLFNARYVVAPEDREMPEFARPIAQFGRHRLYEVETSGYFQLVGSHSAFQGTREDFYPAADAWLGTGQALAGEHPALYFEDVPSGVDALPLADLPAAVRAQPVPEAIDRGAVLSESIGDGVYDALVRVEDDQTYVMLKTAFHPGWQATVDGLPAETVMLMPSYIGVRVPEGTHNVRMEYHATGFRHELMALGLLTLLLLAVYEWRGPRLLERARDARAGRRR